MTAADIVPDPRPFMIAHWHMLEESIAPLRNPDYSFQCSHGHQHVRIPTAIGALESLAEMMKEYEKELHYCHFNAEELLDLAGNITASIANSMENDFDIDSWNKDELEERKAETK